MSSTLLNFTMKHVQKQQQRFIEQLKEMVDNFHEWNNIQDEYKYAEPSCEGILGAIYDESDTESDDDACALDQDDYENGVLCFGESYIYKFRNECDIDVCRFAQKLNEKNFAYYMKRVDDGWELKSPSGFMDIIRVANETVDCHVIVDTFELKENYTGIRKYRCNIEDIEMPC